MEDRGFQFADGVYEVLYRHEGRLIDRDLHMDRLERSLRELRLAAPMGRAALLAVVEDGGAAEQARLRADLYAGDAGQCARLHAFPPAGNAAIDGG